MSLDTVENVPREVFDHVWCPFCGGREFTEYRLEYTACDECNALVEVVPDNRNNDYAVFFDTEGFLLPEGKESRSEYRVPNDVDDEIQGHVRLFDDGAKFYGFTPLARVRNPNWGPIQPLWDGDELVGRVQFTDEGYHLLDGDDRDDE